MAADLFNYIDTNLCRFIEQADMERKRRAQTGLIETFSSFIIQECLHMKWSTVQCLITSAYKHYGNC